MNWLGLYEVQRLPRLFVFMLLKCFIILFLVLQSVVLVF
jgi:hypothetical protein